MTMQFFENNSMGSPSVRLTFKNEKEFNCFCGRIEGTAAFNGECLTDCTKGTEADDNQALMELLKQLKKKKRMTKTGERAVPVTFINCEDFYLLTRAFINAIRF